MMLCGCCSISVWLGILPLSFLHSSILGLLVGITCCLWMLISWSSDSIVLLLGINGSWVLIFLWTLHIQHTLTWSLSSRSHTTSSHLLTMVWLLWVPLSIAWSSWRTSLVSVMFPSIFAAISCVLSAISFYLFSCSLATLSRSGCHCKMMIHLHTWVSYRSSAVENNRTSSIKLRVIALLDV